MFAGGGDRISLNSLFRNYITIPTKEHFPGKTQAPYKTLLSTQSLQIIKKNKECSVMTMGKKCKNSHMEKKYFNS